MHQRKRKNEDIFFKKHTFDVHALLRDSRKDKGKEGVAMSKRYSLQLDNSSKKLEQSLPFMLRRRPAKLEKQMDIINHTYKDSLNKIKTR